MKSQIITPAEASIIFQDLAARQIPFRVRVGGRFGGGKLDQIFVFGNGRDRERFDAARLRFAPDATKHCSRFFTVEPPMPLRAMYVALDKQRYGKKAA